MKTMHHVQIIASVMLFYSFSCIGACQADTLKAIASPKELVRGSESVRAFHLDGYTLYESSGYWILTKELEEEVGSDIFVKKRNLQDKTARAGEIIKNCSFSYRNVISEYFYGVYKGLLLIDSGTDTEPRGLFIFDIDKKKKVYETQYSSPISIEAGGKLTFWTEQGEATMKNCPQLASWEKVGLGAAIEKKIIVDLRTFKTTTTAYRRCVSRQ